MIYPLILIIANLFINSQQVCVRNNYALAPHSKMGTTIERKAEYKQRLREEIQEGQEMSLKVSVVVAVSCELENGNIFRLLRSYLQQSSNPVNFELVFVVNNTPEIREREPVRYQENQDTVAILQYLEGVLTTEPEYIAKLPSWQKETIREIKEKELNIVCVDHSTEGMERNMSVIRNAGVKSVSERNGIDKYNRVVHMMDADVILPNNCIEEIIVNFMFSKSDTLFLNLGFTYWGDEERSICRSLYAYQFWAAHTEMMKGLYKTENSEIIARTPQIVTRLSVWEDIGGIPPYFVDTDDSFLSSILSKRRNYQFVPTVTALTLDRLKGNRWSSNNSWRRDYAKTDRPKSKLSLSPLGGVPAVRMLINSLKARRFDSEAERELLFRFYAINYDHNEWEKAALDYEKEEGRSWENNIERFFAVYYFPFKVLTYEEDPEDMMLRLLKRHIKQDEFDFLLQRIREQQQRHDTFVAYLRTLVQRVIVDNEDLSTIEDPMVGEFFRVCPWAERERKKLQEQVEDIDQAMTILEEKYPDWFKSFTRTPFKKSAEVMFAINRFMQEVRNEPEQFPSTKNLLDTISGQRPFPFEEGRCERVLNEAV